LFGHCPSELVDLFGYNPVIEAEADREAEQIESILSNLNSYEDLLERNYQRLLEVGTWRSRVPVIVEAAERLAKRQTSALLRQPKDQTRKINTTNAMLCRSV